MSFPGITTISLFLLLTLLAGAVHAKIYRWIDEDGRVHMSDKPPRTGTADEVKVIVNVISSPKLPAKTTNPHKSVAANKKVIMYGAKWCGVCVRAKRYFNANNIPFTEYDIDKSKKGRRDYERLGGGGVPIILVGKHRLQGFSVSSFQRYYQKH